jgi:hypothetical protein
MRGETLVADSRRSRSMSIDTVLTFRMITMKAHCSAIAAGGIQTALWPACGADSADIQIV